MNPPSVDDWNSLRTGILKLPSGVEVQNDGARELVATCHWLTLVSFVEQIDPKSLALAPELLTRVLDERTALEEYDPLASYWAALKSLSIDESATVERGDTADATSD